MLLIRRGQEPQIGKWSLPGGAVELGETVEEAIRREVLEETGLVVEPIVVVEVLDRIVRDVDGRVQYHYILVDLLCRVTGGNLCCATDALEAVWVQESEIVQGATMYHLSSAALRVIGKALSLSPQA